MSRASSTPRGRVGLARAALVAVIGLVALLAVPGAASATNPRVDPFLDCYVVNKNGTYTALIGYTNTGSARTIPLGTNNRFSPSRLQGAQPTSFSSGTRHGAFSVTVTPAEVSAGARWEVDGNVLDYMDAARTSSTCPPSTELPEDGNGTGPAIVLVGAGVIGVVAVHRARRRASAAATVGERDDA
jgi:hypothetical protein